MAFVSAGVEDVLVRYTEDPEIDEQVRLFGENMRFVRHRAALSQVALASATCLDRAAISFLERAERSPDLSTLLRVAQALEVRPADLLRNIGPAGSRVRGPRHGDGAPAGPAARFGVNLRWARRRAGFSQEALALRARVDRAAISIYERGVREPNLRTILKLARALSVRPAVLLRGIE